MLLRCTQVGVATAILEIGSLRLLTDPLSIPCWELQGIATTRLWIEEGDCKVGGQARRQAGSRARMVELPTRFRTFLPYDQPPLIPRSTMESPGSGVGSSRLACRGLEQAVSPMRLPIHCQINPSHSGDKGGFTGIPADHAVNTARAVPVTLRNEVGKLWLSDLGSFGGVR